MTRLLSSEPSPLQVQQTQLHQHFYADQVPQPFNHLGGPSLNSLQRSRISCDPGDEKGTKVGAAENFILDATFFAFQGKKKVPQTYLSQFTNFPLKE